MTSWINSLSKRGYIGSYHYEKDAKYRPFSALLPEGSNPKMLYVKLVLLILMCGSFVSLLNSPSIHHDDEHLTQSSAEVPRVSYEPDDTRYVSDVTVDWPKISKAMQLVAGAEHGGGGARVALLNFDDSEVQQWRTVLPRTAAAVARLERAGSNVTWEHLYPEWIDEEELYHAPTCPDLPEPARLAAARRAVLAAEPAVALAVHFVGMKPWFCFRDYDCNWNSPQLRQFASDEAHARWWRAHDAMPAALQGFCLLDERQKALLRWDAAEARAANFSDGHWRVPIADPRRNICATAAGDGEAAAACVEREIKNRRVEGNRVTTSYAKLIDNF
uniref:Uncharacterized protein n=1 Tax=Oryza barthii TaxID=65489 RepID=A0A0D3F6D9_9ORYZ